jgi:hypothetical protein
MTSNNIARNKAHTNGDNHTVLDPTVYGFPFPEIKCHSTFAKGDFKQEPLSHTHEDGTEDITEYSNETSPFGKIGNGFINNYDGKGYVKTIKLDMSDPNFFKNVFEKEIYKTDWYG